MPLQCLYSSPLYRFVQVELPRLGLTFRAPDERTSKSAAERPRGVPALRCDQYGGLKATVWATVGDRGKMEDPKEFPNVPHMFLVFSHRSPMIGLPFTEPTPLGRVSLSLSLSFE